MAQGDGGLLDRFLDADGALEVPMDGINFVDFQLLPAIGTRNLNGCSVVVISSDRGAILAHIPPRPSFASASDPFAGDNYAREMMRQVRELYKGEETYGLFSGPPSSGHVVCAIFNGETALPDQLAIMQSALHDMGLDSATHMYKIPVNTSALGHGSVMVISNRQPGKMPSVYVEDQPVTHPTLSMAELERILQDHLQSDHNISGSSYLYGDSNFQRGFQQLEDGVAETWGHDYPYYLAGEEETSVSATATETATETTTTITDTGAGTTLGRTMDMTMSMGANMATDTAMTGLGNTLEQSASEHAMFGEGGGTASGSAQREAACNEGMSGIDAASDTHAWLSEAASSEEPAARANIWVEVRVRVVPHTFGSDDYVFRDTKRRHVTTKKHDWKRVDYNGQAASEYKRGRATYYTYQKI